AISSSSVSATVGTLTTLRNRPVALSRTTMSANVPPTSAPTLSFILVRLSLWLDDRSAQAPRRNRPWPDPARCSRRECHQVFAHARGGGAVPSRHRLLSGCSGRRQPSARCGEPWNARGARAPYRD